MVRPFARKRTAGLGAAIAAAVMLASVGVSLTSAAPQKGYTIDIVFYTKGIEYYQYMLNGMQDRAKKLGVTLKVSYANFSVTQENDLIKNAIVRHPDGLIFAPMDREALIPAARQATKAGIPVITVGDEVAESGKDAVLSYVGQHFTDLGKVKAEWLAKRLKGKGQVLIVHGIRGLDYVEAQKKAYEVVFKKYPGLEIVEGPYGNLSSEVGRASTENMLTSNPSPDAIWWDHDSLAVGGILAVKEQKLDRKKVVLVSSGGETPAWRAVQKGDLDYTISERPFAIGQSAIQTMYDYLAKKKVPAKFTLVPMSAAITAANAKKITFEQIR